MQTKMISVVNDFSENPAGRYVADGPNSGERFRNEYLLPPLREGKSIVVNLDGALGFGSSFLEEAFGGLVRNGIPASDLLKRITIKSSVSIYGARIRRYIEEAGARNGRTRA